MPCAESTSPVLHVHVIDIGVQLQHLRITFDDTTADSITQRQLLKDNCSVDITWQPACSMRGGRSTTREIATAAVAIVSSYHKERFALSQSSEARSYELPTELDNKCKPVFGGLRQTRDSPVGGAIVVTATSWILRQSS